MCNTHRKLQNVAERNRRRHRKIYHVIRLGDSILLRYNFYNYESLLIKYLTLNKLRHLEEYFNLIQYIK